VTCHKRNGWFAAAPKAHQYINEYRSLCPDYQDCMENTFTRTEFMKNFKLGLSGTDDVITAGMAENSATRESESVPACLVPECLNLKPIFALPGPEIRGSVTTY